PPRPTARATVGSSTSRSWSTPRPLGRLREVRGCSRRPARPRPTDPRARRARRGYMIFVRIDATVPCPLKRGRRGKADMKGERNGPMTKTGIHRTCLGRTAAMVSICGLLLGACATVPTGPGVMALPGIGKSFEHFQIDDTVCRQWASQQPGTTPERTAGVSTAEGAGLGTLLGAGLGAAIGAAAGHPGAGTAVGAAGGLLAGTGVGASRGEAAGHQAQRRYDNAYGQCMYAKGNQIPGTAQR